MDTNQRSLDFDNLNEIPVNKSTVIIKGNSFESVHQAWKELIGYLPLVLTLDVAHDHTIDTALQNQLKKQYKVAIFLKHKEKFNTVVIRGIEKNSRALFEVRKQLLKLDDAEIPICCENHSLTNKLLLNNLDENGNLALFKNENSTSLLNLINRNSNGSNLLNGGITNSSTNILNAKMMQNLDSNNNLATNLEKNGLGSNYNVLSNANNTSVEQQVQSMFHPMLFQAVLQEQYNTLQRQQQLNQRNKHQQSSPTTNSSLQSSQFNNNDLFNHAQAQALNVLSNPSLTEEIGKMLRQHQQQQQHQHQGSIDNLMRTHSVSDIPSLINQTSNIYNNQNDNLHQATIKKEHLTSSCSSPALNAMVMHNNFSMNNSNLNSTGNNTSSTSSNANSLTANNSFNSNGLNSPPTNSGSSFNSSLINTSQSPTVQQQNHMNWPDQRRQINYDECRYLALKNVYEKSDSNEVRIPSSTWSGLGFSKSMSTDTLRNNKLSEWSPSFTNSKLGNNISGLGMDDISSGSTNAVINKMNTAGSDSTDFDWTDMMNQNVQQLQSNKQRSLIKQESEICSSSHPYSSSYLNSLIGNNGNQFANSLTSFTPSINLQNNSFTNLGDGLTDVRFDVNDIDLDKVLIELDMFKFADVFQKLKINFVRFLTLTESDLEKMGIPYHGRRKLYTTIIQLRPFFSSSQVNNNYLTANGIKKSDEENTKVGLIKQEIKAISNSSFSDLNDSQKTVTKDVNDNLTKPISLFDTSPSMSNETTDSANEKDQRSIEEGLKSPQKDFVDICTEFESITFKNCKMDNEESKTMDNELVKKNDSFELEKDDSARQSTTGESREHNGDKNVILKKQSLNEETSDEECSENKMLDQSSDEQNLVKHAVQEVAQA